MMKAIFLFLYGLLFFGMISCGSAEKSKETVEAAEKTDTCQLDSLNTYEVFVPERKSVNEKLPLIIIIDAHGNGAFAIENFKHSAKKYSVILVASNLVKNGFVNYEGAIENVIKDVHQKYPVSETVFMTGFSGGARMALGYGLTHQLNGLILCGALANADQINAIRCPVYAISGMDDFNFIETAQFLFSEQSIPNNLKIELTNSSHNWPDSLMLTNALGLLYLSNPNANSIKKSLITEYTQTQSTRIDSLEKKKDLMKAALIARNLSITAPFNNDNSFAPKYNDLVANSDYLSQLKRLKDCLNLEIKTRQPYIDAFSTKDSLWWKNEIRVLNDKINTEKDSFQKDMFQRIKGFLGIACYSFGNQVVKEKNAEMLNKIVSVYRTLEPENPYVLYFSSFPYFWAGNKEETISTLKKAIEAGFTDTNQIKNDFPESITSKL